jgi:hypothetical protein
MATARNIVARIEKLETTRRRPDEMLLVWREPDGDVAAAISNAVYAAGDKVICVEWFGEKPPPAPKWYRHMRFEMDRIEYDYIMRSVNRLVEAMRCSINQLTKFPTVPLSRWPLLLARPIWTLM